jgi:hypothetical protein
MLALDGLFQPLHDFALSRKFIVHCLIKHLEIFPGVLLYSSCNYVRSHFSSTSDAIEFVCLATARDAFLLSRNFSEYEMLTRTHSFVSTLTNYLSELNEELNVALKLKHHIS